MYGSEILMQENPYNPWVKRHYRRSSRRRSRRNPISAMNPLSVAKVQSFYKGVTMKDALFGTVGLAGASLVPGMVIPNATTTTRKLARTVLAFFTAGVLGLAAESVGDKMNGRAAVIGGMAGAIAHTANLWAGIKFAGRTGISGSRRVGAARIVSPSFRRESETVSLITP